MNPITIIIATGIVSVAVVVACAIALYVKRLRRELAQQADVVQGLLQHRLNIAPYLIEIIRKYTNGIAGVDNFVTLRAGLLNDHTLTPGRWQKEKEIEQKVASFFDAERDNKELVHNLHYLDVKKELQTLASDLNKAVNTYNTTVELFHSLGRKVPLRNPPLFIGKTQ